MEEKEIFNFENLSPMKIKMKRKKNIMNWKFILSIITILRAAYYPYLVKNMKILFSDMQRECCYYFCFIFYYNNIFGRRKYRFEKYY